MARERKQANGASAALLGIPLVAALCCGLPVVLAAVGLTAAGAFLAANRYFVFGGAVVLMGLVMLARVRLRPTGKECGRDE